MLPTAVLSTTVLAMTSVLSSTAAQATSTPYTLLQPSMMGSGCMPGSTFTEVAADGQSISILFSNFDAMTNPTTNRVRKTCNFALPIEAAPGTSIGFYKIDFRGYAYVPAAAGAYGSLTNEFFFAGQQGPTMSKKFEAGDDMPIYETTTINVQSVIWSPCGGSTNFRINSGIIAYKPLGESQDVQMQIDSVDGAVNGQVKVYVEARKCTPSGEIIHPAPTATTPAIAPAPTTSAPTTAAPMTPAPTAPTPTTPTPTITALSVPPPTTPTPTTPEPTTEPPTSEPETPDPTTSESDTPEPTTSEIETPEPTTSEPESPEPTTSEPETPEPTTSEPDTPERTTSEPETPEPTTSEPESPEPTTSEPESSETTTFEPETPEPTISQATTPVPTPASASSMPATVAPFEPELLTPTMMTSS